MQKVLNVPQMARRLGISRSLAYREVAAGKIPATRIGKRRYVIAESVLERFLDPYQAKRGHD